MRALIVSAAALMLAGCVAQGDPSAQGACNLVAPPGRQVCGQTAEDQAYIDYFVTRYGAACRWQQRADKPCVQIKVEINPETLTPAKRKLLDRILHPDAKKPAPKKKLFMGWLREAPK